VVLERAQVVLGERPIDLDHGLPESAPEHRRKPQIVDGGVLEEHRVPDLRLSLRR
jgi:hypothetical protein